MMLGLSLVTLVYLCCSDAMPVEDISTQGTSEHTLVLWECHGDICEQNKHFCNHQDKRCNSCADFYHMCFSTMHQPNCTRYCRNLLEQEFKDRSCENPPEILNGKHNATKTSFQQGEIVSYSCYKRHRLKGFQNITCMPFGQWSSRPICEVIVCPMPEAPENGLVSVVSLSSDIGKRSLDVGESVQYTCSSDYQLLGTTLSVCLENGNFDHQWPTCIPVQSENDSNFDYQMATYIIASVALLIVLILIVLLVFMKRKQSNGHASDALASANLTAGQYPQNVVIADESNLKTEQTKVPSRLCISSTETGIQSVKYDGNAHIMNSQSPKPVIKTTTVQDNMTTRSKASAVESNECQSNSTRSCYNITATNNNKANKIINNNCNANDNTDYPDFDDRNLDTSAKRRDQSSSNGSKTAKKNELSGGANNNDDANGIINETHINVVINNNVTTSAQETKENQNDAAPYPITTKCVEEQGRNENKLSPKTNIETLSPRNLSYSVEQCKSQNIKDGEKAIGTENVDLNSVGQMLSRKLSLTSYDKSNSLMDSVKHID